MDFRRLRYFMQIVEAGSISRASRSLNVAQPALTESIQWLEGEFETPLLQRSTHGVATTEGGQRLYEHCQILFKQLERARLDVRKSVERPSGHVTVGMPHSIVKVLTVALLEATTRLYPEVQVEISQDQSHLLSDRIRSGQLDFAVMAATRLTAGLVSSPLLREELFFIEKGTAEGGIDSGGIAFADAAMRRYVLPSVGNGLRASVEGRQTTIALGGPSKMLRIYSTKDGKLLNEVKKHTDWVTAMEFSPDGVLLASGDRNGGLFVWEAHTAREYFSLRGHTAMIAEVKSPTFQRAGVGERTHDGRLWEMENGRQIRTWADARRWHAGRQLRPRWPVGDGGPR